MKIILLLVGLLYSLSSTGQTKHLAVESNHSTVGFTISVAGFTKVTGKFTDFDITMDWHDSDLDSCWISATIKVESINTGIPGRDEHLRSGDFFDTNSYPNILFQSDSIVQVNSSNYRAHGKLTMHGITKALVLPFEIVKIEDNTIGISSTTTINRLDFEVGNEFEHSAIPDFLSDNVEFECYIWTKKRKS